MTPNFVILEPLIYLRELEDRRQTILKSIEEQGKLTDELRDKIHATQSKTELEDLYLPYKPKRRTKGQIAIEAGLEPLADLLWNEPKNDPESTALSFVDAEKGVADSKAALDGARYILMECFAEDAGLLAKVRDYLAKKCRYRIKSDRRQRNRRCKIPRLFLPPRIIEKCTFSPCISHVPWT